MSKDGAGRSVLESDTSRTSYTHRGLSSGSTHYYRVSATNSAGTGPPSNSANATTDSVDLPGAPQSLSARPDGETEIDLSWSRPSSDGGSRVTGYRIEVSEDDSGWSVLESDTGRTSYTHRGLSSGSTHYYRVSATNSAGTGPHSNTAHATTSAPCEGMTLEQATKGRHTEIVQCLVDKGADVNAKASDGNPLLHLAIRGNFIEIVRILVDAGANASAKDVEGNPLLHRAIKGKFTEIVRILVVDGRADVDARDSAGNPPLHRAIKGNFIDIVRILVDAGANPSAKDSEGDPLLYRAIRGQFVDIVGILVNVGADVNARTADGDLLLTVAKKTRNAEIIKILEDAGATE